MKTLMLAATVVTLAFGAAQAETGSNVAQYQVFAQATPAGSTTDFRATSPVTASTYQWTNPEAYRKHWQSFPIPSNG